MSAPHLGEIKSGTAQVSTISRFHHIDALRALAVLLVAISHAGLGSVVPGGAGVTIFFTISGFIITYILLRERSRTGTFSLSSFYLKRLFKLAPPLFVIIVVPTVIYSFFERIDWYAVLAQVFFVYNWLRISVESSVLPGSGITWSLAIEEQFYIGFSIFWLFASRAKYYLQILQCVAAAAVMWAFCTRLVLAILRVSEYRIEFGTDSRLDSIAIGILCATLCGGVNGEAQRPATQARWNALFRSSWMFVVAILVFLVASAFPNDFFKDTLRYLLQSLAVGVIILYGMQGPSGVLGRAYNAACKLKLVQTIGLASYSIYLVHVPLYKLTDWVGLGGTGVLLVLLKVLAGVFIGVLLWRFLEVPVERYKVRLFSPREKQLGNQPQPAP